MTAEALELTPPRRAATELYVRLSGDENGGWVLSGSGNPARRFADFGIALDTARREPDAHDATIEIWQDGEYICCLPPGAHPNCGVAAPFDRAEPQDRVTTAAERCAHRAASVLLATAGPLFWAAVVLLVLAASLGWRVALL
jgi:hypothetical protein